MTSTAPHSQVVQKQFGEQASAYLSSAVHAQGTEFALLQAELAGQGDARVLDVPGDEPGPFGVGRALRVDLQP